MNTNLNSKMLRLGIIGIGTYGGTLLAGLLRALNEHSHLPIELVAIFDRNQEKLRPFIEERERGLTICNSAQEVIGLADVNIIGVTSSQIPVLFNELGFDESNLGSVREQFIFMDGQHAIRQISNSGTLIYGKIMFTPWVRYGRGIIGFWPGTLHCDVIDKLCSIFGSLGRLWMANNPALLPRIRATAGCGIAMAGVVLSSMHKSFIGLGLTANQADEAISSLVSGLMEYTSRGNSVQELAQSVCSSDNSFTQIMLATKHAQQLEDSILAMINSLKPVIDEE